MSETKARTLANALREYPKDGVPARRRALAMEAADELERLDALLNTPAIVNFTESVKLEAAHQRERWGDAHDLSKNPEEWFWLVGYLAGKACHAFRDGRRGKGLHHLVSTSAALANQHRIVMDDPNYGKPYYKKLEDLLPEGKKQ